FYRDQRQGSDRSAQKIVPIIVDLLKPQSVLDIGCGVGTWGKAFAEHGVPIVTGVDGPWIRPEAFALGKDYLVTFDFNAASIPFNPALPLQRYDLVITLEFIEHIDPQKAPALIKLMTSLAPVVIAGGAIPGQGGTHHVNE